MISLFNNIVGDLCYEYSMFSLVHFFSPICQIYDLSIWLFSWVISIWPYIMCNLKYKIWLLRYVATTFNFVPSDSTIGSYYSFIWLVFILLLKLTENTLAVDGEYKKSGSRNGQICNVIIFTNLSQWEAAFKLIKAVREGRKGNCTRLED